MFGRDRLEAMHARLREVGDGLGVAFTPRAHAPSTKKALALSEHARRHNRLDAWREAAMEAHWAEARDLEDPEVLADLAVRAGLDPDAALAFLGEDEVPALLLAQRREAHRWGVTGIPTWFLLPDGWNPGDARPPEGAPQPVRVVGCQPMEVVERAAHMAGATPRAPS